MVNLKNIIRTALVIRIIMLYLLLSIFVDLHPVAGNIINSYGHFTDQNKSEKVMSDTLHKAVISGDADLVNALLMSGINPNLIDNAGWTALDYAKKRNRVEIKKVLIKNGAVTYQKSIPDMREGPYIRLLDYLTFEVFFLKNTNNKSTIESSVYPISNLPMKINGVLINPEDLDFTGKPCIANNTFSDSKKIFIVGDIHGEYERVQLLLKSNNIVDSEGNWCWGKGHLVFVGDIFDRGNKVTETLWLIYSLEKQAALRGGRVHLLLGNHEPMIFKDDLRYITNDYYSLCENLGLSYSDLFDERTLFGHWLRQKPVMVQINDYAFVHAGISPEFCDMQIGVDSLNCIVSEYMNNKEDEKNITNREFILGSKGVLWYRGMVADGIRKDVMGKPDLDKALEFYNAKAFIIGHTEVDSISGFHDGKVIDVNIPKSDINIPEQGLLIRRHKLWVAYDSKKKKLLITY